MARPKKTDPTGPEKEPGAPGAKDGQPDPDELARRRAGKATNGGTSVADRQDEDNTEPEEELFPLGSLPGDPKVTLKTLVKAGTPVKKTASMGTAAVPITSDGFFDPEEEVTLLVRALPGGIIPVPTHEKSDTARHKIKEWRFTQSLTPIYVQHAGSMYTREQVLEMLSSAGVSSAKITELIGDETARAAQG